jgi:hypothetical protein
MPELLATTFITEILKKIVGALSQRIEQALSKGPDSSLAHLIELHEALRTLQNSIKQLIRLLQDLETGRLSAEPTRMHVYPILHRSREALRHAVLAINELKPLLSIMSDDALDELLLDFCEKDERDALDLMGWFNYEVFDVLPGRLLRSSERICPQSRALGTSTWQGAPLKSSAVELLVRLESLKEQGEQARRGVASLIKTQYNGEQIRAQVEKRRKSHSKLSPSERRIQEIRRSNPGPDPVL